MWKAQVSNTVGICFYPTNSHKLFSIRNNCQQEQQLQTNFGCFYLQQITRSSDFSFTSLWSSEEYNFIRIIGARVFAAIDGKVYCRRLISETSATPDINIAVVGDLLLSELLAYLIVSRSHARGTPSHHAVHHEPFYTILDLYSFTCRKLLTDLTLSNVFHIFVSSYEGRRNELLCKGDRFLRQSSLFYIQTPYT